LNPRGGCNPRERRLPQQRVGIAFHETVMAAKPV
jgi:hypothetical protein